MYTIPRLMLGIGFVVASASLHAQETSLKAKQINIGKNEAVEEVVVTGTLIRGVAPVGSPLTVISRDEIEKSGYGRVQDYIATLPQNFTGSATEETNPFTDNGAANFTRGQGIDLRGLGASGTLILVDGRRQPGGGLEGSFVDISTIPSAAIERIEVLTDGASALYGSDAIGGVVNFVLRKDYEGMEVRARVASTDEFADEMQASALGGTSWGGGNLLVGYQYSKRDALMAADRFYASRNQDYRSLGGSDFRTVFGNPGTIRRSGQPNYAIPMGQNGVGLTAGQLLPGQSNYNDAVTGIANQPEQIQHDAFARLFWQPLPEAELAVNARYSRREMTLPFPGVTTALSVPATNPFYVNPYGGTGAVQVAYDFTDVIGHSIQSSKTDSYVIGIDGKMGLAGDWSLNIAADHARQKNAWSYSNRINSGRRTACLSGVATAAQCPGTPLNVFGDGAMTRNDAATLNFIRFTDYDQGTVSVDTVTAIADGSLLEMPAGALKLAIGTDYRDEKLETSGYNFAPATGLRVEDNPGVGNPDRQVASLFGELVVPLLGHGADADSASLQLSLAARYEDYSDFGSTVDPRVGIAFAPVPDLVVRGSWGTSFRAPRFNEFSQSANPPSSFALPVADPRSPTDLSLALALTGSDPDLDPETATIWTAGVDLTPSSLAGFTLSATYFHIDYKDKIRLGGEFGDTLFFEDLWSSIITRNPTQAQIDAICARPDFQDVGFGACPFVEAPTVILDLRLRNLSAVNVRGVDVSLGYDKASSVGDWSFGLAGTYTLTYDRAVSEGAPLVELLDTVGNPIALRLRASAGWSRLGWSANAVVNHAASYDDPSRDRAVSSWTTVDMSVGYQFQGGGWAEGAGAQLAVINVLDREPPFVNIASGYDPSNARDTGRSVSLSVTKRW